MMATTHERLHKQLTGFDAEAIQRLVDAAITDREQVEDVIRGNEDGRRILAGYLQMSEDKVLQGLDWDEWPGYCGVTLSGPCPLGGVLAPERTDEEPGAAAPELSVSLPDHHSLSENFQPVRNQGRVGTCTAFATEAVLEGQHEQVDLSERFTYFHTKRIDGHPDTDGSWLKYSMKVLAEYGTCREETWPYVEDRKALRTQPPSAASHEAMRFKPQSSAISVGRKDVSAIRGQIAQGWPVAISLPIFRSSYNSLRFHSQGRFLMKLGTFDAVAGYHAMCAVAYFDNPYLSRQGESEEIGGGAFLVRNSWGTTWAKDNPLAKLVSAGPGYAIIPFGYVQAYCFEAFTVTAKSSSLRLGQNELVSTAAAFGKSWWQRTRNGVVTSARQRITEFV